MHIAIITAGGAGMFCGSCMHDNTWAKALMQAGHEVSLLPTYTPIRVDEENLSQQRVFFGGLNVYFDSTVPLWNRVPRVLTRWLDNPRLIQWATKFSVSNDARMLGKLTLDMLAGEQGPQRPQCRELADHIGRQLKPDAVIFSNALLSGALSSVREHFSGPIFCTLQGDDVFLDSLPDPYHQKAVDAISERAAQFDGFFTHSKFYRDYIANYLSLPIEKFHLLPLSIDLSHHDGVPKTALSDTPLIGYFARIAPEKGLKNLVRAAIHLHEQGVDFRLHAGGYRGPAHESYFQEVLREAAPLGERFQYIGSPDTHPEKVAFLKSLDLLSVPTEFLEPKGLYVIEAMANGVPVVQPAHGAFPELIEATGGGHLTTAGDPAALSEGLEHLLTDHSRRHQLASAGHGNVRKLFTTERLAEATIQALTHSTTH